MAVISCLVSFTPQGSKQKLCWFLAPFWVCRGNRDGRVRVGVICNLVLRYCLSFLLSSICTRGSQQPRGGLSLSRFSICSYVIPGSQLLVGWGRSESKKAEAPPQKQSMNESIITIRNTTELENYQKLSHCQKSQKWKN